MNFWIERKKLVESVGFIQCVNDLFSEIEDPSARWCDDCGYLCTGGEHCCPDLDPADLACEVDLGCSVDLNCSVDLGGK